jgi:hypothetical protein
LIGQGLTDRTFTKRVAQFGKCGSCWTGYPGQHRPSAGWILQGVRHDRHHMGNL